MSELPEPAERVVRALAGRLASEGFVPGRNDGWLERHRDGVEHRFQLRATEFEDGVELAVDAAVRHELVERIFHATSGFPPPTQRDTPTMGAALAELLRPAGAPITIARRDPIEPVVDAVEAAARAAEPWLERFSALSAIDEELNRDVRRESIWRPLPWFRASTGSIVAKLLDRPALEGLAEAYRLDLMGFASGFYVPRFEALVADLLSHTVTELRARASG